MSVDDLATLSALDIARQVFRTEAEASDGRVVDTAGDSVLLVFETAIGAVRAAAGIQRRLSQAHDESTGLQLCFRIGIHLGDVIEKADGTVYGEGVNIAARLQAIAAPGGVVVSQAIQDTCADHLGAVFEDIGQQRVKNIAKPVRAFRLVRMRDIPVNPQGKERGTEDVRRSNDASRTGRFASLKRRRVWVSSLIVTCFVVGALLVAQGFRSDGAKQPTPGAASTVNIDQEIMIRRATAVLAFVDKQGAKSSSTLGDDLADAVAARLLRDGQRVIGRAATMHQDSSAPDFVRIGQEQGVRFVLAGRIRREVDRIQVDAYLTEIASGAVFRLHEDEFKSEEEAMRSGYGSAVARALNARFYEIETVRARLPGHEKDPVDVLALALRDLDRGNTQEELEHARSQFEFAVNADPNSVEASSGLGLAHLAQFYCLCSGSPREKLDAAEKAVRRALNLAPDSPQSLVAWGDILFLRQRPEDALRVWRKALEIDPDYQNAHVRIASALIKQGRVADAQDHLSHVTDLRPYQLRRQQWLLQSLADASFFQGQDAEAYEILRNWTAEFPDSGRPYLMMAAIDALHGRKADAAANMARHRQMLPQSTVSYVVLTYPSTDPGFLSQRARLVAGLREAGLPEGDK
jgi:TolB-like protein/Tfp pilus assembly protein PilF